MPFCDEIATLLGTMMAIAGDRGRPKAARAVDRANSNNRIAIIVHTRDQRGAQLMFSAV